MDSGLTFTRNARSVVVLLGGLVLTGLFTLFAEGGLEWISDGDRTSDPLATRLSRLVLGLALLGGLVVAGLFLARLLSR